jgi:hypothetical protein
MHEENPWQQQALSTERQCPKNGDEKKSPAATPWQENSGKSEPATCEDS